MPTNKFSIAVILRKQPDVLIGAADAGRGDPIGRQPVHPLAAKPDPPAGHCKFCIMQLNTVVFPAPFGPMMLWMAPSRTSRSSSLTATRPPKRMVRRSVVRIVPPRAPRRSFSDSRPASAALPALARLRRPRATRGGASPKATAPPA